MLEVVRGSGAACVLAFRWQQRAAWTKGLLSTRGAAPAPPTLPTPHPTPQHLPDTAAAHRQAIRTAATPVASPAPPPFPPRSHGLPRGRMGHTDAWSAPKGWVRARGSGVLSRVPARRRRRQRALEPTNHPPTHQPSACRFARAQGSRTTRTCGPLPACLAAAPTPPRAWRAPRSLARRPPRLMLPTRASSLASCRAPALAARAAAQPCTTRPRRALECVWEGGGGGAMVVCCCCMARAPCSTHQAPQLPPTHLTTTPPHPTCSPGARVPASFLHARGRGHALPLAQARLAARAAHRGLW